MGNTIGPIIAATGIKVAWIAAAELQWVDLGASTASADVPLCEHLLCVKQLTLAIYLQPLNSSNPW